MPQKPWEREGRGRFEFFYREECAKIIGRMEEQMGRALLQAERDAVLIPRALELMRALDEVHRTDQPDRVRNRILRELKRLEEGLP